MANFSCAQIAERLSVSTEAARAIVKRHRVPAFMGVHDDIDPFLRDIHAVGLPALVALKV